MINKEDAAKWLATSLENWGTVNCKGSIPSSSFLLPTGSRKARHRADNAAIGGAVPPRWMD